MLSYRNSLTATAATIANFHYKINKIRKLDINSVIQTI